MVWCSVKAQGQSFYLFTQRSQMNLIFIYEGIISWWESLSKLRPFVIYSPLSRVDVYKAPPLLCDISISIQPSLANLRCNLSQSSAPDDAPAWW